MTNNKNKTCEHRLCSNTVLLRNPCVFELSRGKKSILFILKTHKFTNYANKNCSITDFKISTDSHEDETKQV